MTKRFNLIIRFLQEAARIVPMESIVFAISGCSPETTVPAYKCAQAVLSIAHTSSLPVSKLMANGCNEGARSLLSAAHRQHIHYYPSLMTDDVIHKEHHQCNPFIITDDDIHEEHYQYYPLVKKIPLQRQKLPLHRQTEVYQRSDVPSHIVLEEGMVQRKYTKKFKHKLFSSQNERIDSDFMQESRFLASVPLKVDPMHEKKLLHEYDPDLIARHFHRLSRDVNHRAEILAYQGSLNLISGRNIGEAYPISEALSPTMAVNSFIPLPRILHNARKDLASLSRGHKLGSRATLNCDMLNKVNDIIKNHLFPCVTMLGGFMEQQVRVPLVNNPLDTAKALQTTDSSGAVGVWALFALDKKDIASILSSKRNRALVIQITKFIEGILSSNAAKKRVREQITSYNAKLQFLLQGMNRTVTCSSQYISYSLERELVDICKERKITTNTKVGDILVHWDARFEATALALVPKPYQPLLARWLIWALNIYQLRESLASYTTVGVIGLVNSGKSTLVNKVFGRQVSNNVSYITNYFISFYRQYKVLHKQHVQQYLLFIIWMTLWKD